MPIKTLPEILFIIVLAALTASCNPAGTQAADKGSQPPKAFADPAPPEVREPAVEAPPEPKDHPDVEFYGKPKPLHPDAVTHDWVSFLGPTHNAVSSETHLLKDFTGGEPKLLWALEKGTSYTSPAIQGEYLVYLHRAGNVERVECLHPETGQLYWQFEYPTDFSDR